MSELYETVYKSKPPLIDGLLYPGTYIFAGSPKLGKSFLMAQLAYHISTGTPLWNYTVRKGTVLYLALDDKLADKKDEFRIMAERIENFDNGEKAFQNLDESIMNEPEYQLPEPSAMMSARSYKTKFAEPLISRLKSLINTLFA